MKIHFMMVLALLAAGTAQAQSLESSGPIDVESQQLDVQNAQGKATFSGNVKITQGGLTLTAPQVNVTYGAGGQGDIKEMQATGGVVLTRTGPVEERATGTQATYAPQSGQLVLTGEVTLTRGPSRLSGDKLVYNVKEGTAKVTNSSGPVKARFVPQK